MTNKTDDLRQEVNARIVEAMEKGLPPWRQPFRRDPNCGFPTNAVTQKKYRGVNPLLLTAAAMGRGYQAKWWAAYGQWEAMGAHVRRDERGTAICIYRPFRAKDEENNRKPRRFFVGRAWVFNIEQVAGDHLSLFRPGADLEDLFLARQGYDHVDAALDACGAKVVVGPEPEYHYPPEDTIVMPKKSLFVDLRSYYATKFHEYLHWTEPRTGWPPKHAALQGADLRAMTELAAEIGTCYLESELELPHCEDMTNHHKYIQTWLAVLRGNPRRIFEAASQASKGVDYVLGRSQPVTAETDEEAA
jgi:antirestriction protein ArdC